LRFVEADSFDGGACGGRCLGNVYVAADPKVSEQHRAIGGNKEVACLEIALRVLALARVASTVYKKQQFP
jgi:hypothetical protein